MKILNRNLDALLVLASDELLKKDLEYANSLDTSDVHISKKTDRRILKMIKRFERGSGWDSLPLALRRSVAAVLVACTAAFGVCMGVEPVRAAIIDTVIEWYDKFVSVFYIPDVTTPSIIEEYREPNLQLSGTERAVMTQTKAINHITYTNGECTVLEYRQSLINSVPTDLDERNCTISEIEIGDYSGRLFIYSDGRKALTWHDNQYRYAIISYSSDIASDTLVKIGESVK